MDLSDVIAIVATLVAIGTWSHSISLRRRLSLAETASALPDLLWKEYVARNIVDPSDPTKTINVRELLLRLTDNAPSDRHRRDEFRDESLSLDSPENRWAYQMSVALEHVGILVLSGVIPLDLVMALCSVSIVNDWDLCRPLVERMWNDDSIRSRTDPDIPFQRRHAWWLSLVAAKYLTRQWQGGQWEDYVPADKKWSDDFEALLRHAEVASLGSSAGPGLQRAIERWG